MSYDKIRKLAPILALILIFFADFRRLCRQKSCGRRRSGDKSYYIGVNNLGFGRSDARHVRG
jgi:hypothetical protein